MPLVPPVRTAIFPSSLRAIICLHAGETNLGLQSLVRNRENRKSSLQKRRHADPQDVAALSLLSPLWRRVRSHHHLRPPRRVCQLRDEEISDGGDLRGTCANCRRPELQSAFGHAAVLGDWLELT